MTLAEGSCSCLVVCPTQILPVVQPHCFLPPPYGNTLQLSLWGPTIGSCSCPSVHPRSLTLLTMVFQLCSIYLFICNLVHLPFTMALTTLLFCIVASVFLLPPSPPNWLHFHILLLSPLYIAQKPALDGDNLHIINIR